MIVLQKPTLKKKINLSLQKPESVGVPINHWTAEESACKAIKDNIVESISAR